MTRYYLVTSAVPRPLYWTAGGTISSDPAQRATYTEADAGAALRRAEAVWQPWGYSFQVRAEQP